ncbi:hypothetical protein G9A89_009409 [Geosiphon pyriformis]|nr:hypothetical protein G9A89_009409 [Geosiphon pyriformis]
MEAMQYQALVGNDWLSKVNVPATCDHFKAPPREKLLIELKEEKKKPTWKAYQISWADANHNELLPILSWDDKGKKKEKKLIWKPNLKAWSKDNLSKPTTE